MTETKSAFLRMVKSYGITDTNHFWLLDMDVMTETKSAFLRLVKSYGMADTNHFRLLDMDVRPCSPYWLTIFSI